MMVIEVERRQEDGIIDTKNKMNKGWEGSLSLLASVLTRGLVVVWLSMIITARG